MNKDDCKQTVLLRLSTNNETRGKPDTPPQHLKRVLYAYTQCMQPSDIENVTKCIGTLKATKAADVTQLVEGPFNLIEVFGELFRLPCFQSVDFEPAELIKANKTYFGVSRSSSFSSM